MVASRVSVLGSSQQCWASLNYRLVYQASSVEQTITVGSWLKPAMLVEPSLPTGGSNRQCCLQQHCRFGFQADSDGSTSTAGSCHELTVPYLSSLPCANRQWSLFRILLFYNLFYFILFFWWNRVSLYIRYVDNRTINIKHYKCYYYSSNVLNFVIKHYKCYVYNY